jgi:hypothetical protein
MTAYRDRLIEQHFLAACEARPGKIDEVTGADLAVIIAKDAQRWGRHPFRGHIPKSAIKWLRDQVRHAHPVWGSTGLRVMANGRSPVNKTIDMCVAHATGETDRGHWGYAQIFLHGRRHLTSRQAVYAARSWLRMDVHYDRVGTAKCKRLGLWRLDHAEELHAELRTQVIAAFNGTPLGSNWDWPHRKPCSNAHLIQNAFITIGDRPHVNASLVRASHRQQKFTVTYTLDWHTLHNKLVGEKADVYKPGLSTMPSHKTIIASVLQQGDVTRVHYSQQGRGCSAAMAEGIYVDGVICATTDAKAAGRFALKLAGRRLEERFKQAHEEVIND